MPKAFLYLIIGCMILSCNNSSERGENVVTEVLETNARFITNFKKTFEGVELPLFVKSIKNNENVNLETKSGAEITIPANAFVDKEGNEVKGEVTIKYKEIKSPSDIIIENVDMTYDSAGVTYQFQTAGMFDLRAYSGNDEVFLKKGKSIELSYISNKKGDYNLYYYDKKWNYQGVSKGEVPLNAELGKIQEVQPLKPVKTNPDKDLILDIDYSHKKIPELKIYKKVIWKYTGDLKQSEVAEILSVPVSEPEILLSKGKYIYRFKTSKGAFEFPVLPVFQPKVYEKAIKQYEEYIAQNSTPVQVKRKVNISQLGLMNYDILYHRSDAVLVDAEFYIKNEPEKQIKDLPLFHITGEDDVVVNVGNQKKIYYSKKLTNKLVVVLPDKTVAVLGTDEFMNAVNSNKEKNTTRFELKKIDKPVTSPDDLDKIISSL